MNFSKDFEKFASMLDDIWSLKGQTLTAGGRMAFFRALEDLPLNEVQAGLHAHSRDPKRGQYLPMPADVIAQIGAIVAADGRPGAEEAWAVAFRGTDEAATVVWCDEMAEAFGMARPLLLAGDEVGARMSFKETYNRLLAAARAARTPAKWSVSLGYDVAARDAAIRPHVEAGRLPPTELPVVPLLGLETMLGLPPPKDASPTNLAAREKAFVQLRALREKFVSRNTGPSPDEADKQRTAALKAEASRRVSEYQAQSATAGETS